MVVIAACTALSGGLLSAAPAFGAPDAGTDSQPRSGHNTQPGSASATPGPSGSGRVKDPGKKLGTGWKSSPDRAVTAAADADGLHILVADSKEAYAWKTAAILAEPGMPADSWIGNQCLMDRDHAAVVYAPRTFTNKPDLFQGGAFTAIVNTSTGAVTKLGFTASLAYFDPTCNTSAHTAAFTAYRDMNDPAAVKTRVVTVNTAGKQLTQASVHGEVTSAAPVTGGAIGAIGRDLVRLGDTGKSKAGKTSKVTSVDAVAFDIRPLDARGKEIAFVERGNKKHTAKIWRGHGRPATVASGAPGALDLAPGAPGKAFLTGKTTGVVHTKGTGITRLDAPADSDVSTQGRLAVDPVLMPGMRAGLERIANAGRGFTKASQTEHGKAAAESAVPPKTLAKTAPTTITSTATTTGTEVTQQVAPQTAAGTEEPSPALGGSTKPVTETAPGGLSTQMERTALTTTATASDPAHEPTDPDRWCSISRNDVSAQALQPTSNQVEWAADMAVRGNLTSGWIRQGGYRDQAGLGTVDPQGLFPRPTLDGKTGAQIPVNVLLGILSQESNLWQAESGAVPGQMGSPLAAVDGYYGHKTGGTVADFWNIHWDKSDCGYGVGQVTDGMRMAGHEKDHETALSPAKQKIVAVDYASNIAASMKILADKWNEVHKAGQTVTVNNDDPSKVENWFTAVWNYNLGFNPPGASGASWGLGWYNNPANPVYKNDNPFMDTTVDSNANHDAAHPQDWPYEEKVMGWAAWSTDTGFSYATSGRQDWAGESGFSSVGFRPAWWINNIQRSWVSPSKSTFCNSNNNCDPSSPPDCPDADCYKKYWWNQSNATWKDDCSSTCGNENIKYQSLVAEPGRGYRLKNGTPVCSGAPSGATVVASVPNGTPTWSDCGAVKSDGTFRFTFYADVQGQYEAKADLHQIGGGYGGHFWYAHSRDTDHLGGTTSGPLTVRGTWIPNGSFDLAQVWVHVPDTGAQEKRAHYEISGAVGGPYDRYVNQDGNNNKWVSLGAFKFNSTPTVSLSNYSPTGSADKDVAYGAIAFQPVKGTFVHRTLTAASVFDPNQELNSNWPVTELNTPIRSEKSLYDWATELSHGTDGGPLWDGAASNSVSSEGLTGWPRCTDEANKDECVGPKTYDAGKQWYQDVKAGGYTPNADGSVPSMSIPMWMGMSNIRPNPSASPDQAYQDANSYKIKSDVDVTFVKDDTGHIIPGSESASYDARVGNAHLPVFVTQLIKAISADYHIAAPDLTYTTPDALEYGRTYTADPLVDGDTPGQAYFPHFRGARLNSDNTCVDFRAVGGGVHGYRAMVGHKSINDNVKAWLDKVNASPDTNFSVRRAAGDIYSMFFKNSGEWNNNMWGSMIGNAPPIWHDIAAAFCADGSVKPTHLQANNDADPSNGLVWQSYMPDLYVYIDGKMSDDLGRPAGGRVHVGDWKNFSNFPASAPNGNGFASCDAFHRGSGGNPWSVDAPVPVFGDGPGNRPSSVVHCDDSSVKFTTNLTQ
ncbi:hypothetical protein [Streptomyces sp. NBC_00203]|uniref:hypothetical protein n=1 Tax=Streptomyces sp. NBC_00203 TaxID=2975680 RepID=UPI003254AD97